MSEKETFGGYVKRRRIALGKTLRQFCLENNLDPGNHSRLERGRLPPPQEKKLESLAEQLRLKKGSDDWYHFFDLASAEKGTIPRDLLSDEELMDKLPVLFRTLRGQKVSDDDLDDLIRKIREQ